MSKRTVQVPVGKKFQIAEGTFEVEHMQHFRGVIRLAKYEWRDPGYWHLLDLMEGTPERVFEEAEAAYGVALKMM